MRYWFMSHCYRGIINLPAFDGQGRTKQGNIVNTGSRETTDYLGNQRTSRNSPVFCVFLWERQAFVIYIYTSVNRNAGEAMEMKLNIKWCKLGIYIDDSYTLKMKYPLNKWYMFCKIELKNRKTQSNHIGRFYEIWWPNILLMRVMVSTLPIFNFFKGRYHSVFYCFLLKKNN